MIPQAGGWRVVTYSGLTAGSQMGIDESLARQGEPTLRLFQWRRPALSYGFRRELPPWAEARLLAPHKIDVVERPTGGGIAVHGSDLSCSVTMRTEPRWSLRRVMATTCEALTHTVNAWGLDARWVCDIEQPLRITYCLTQESPYAILIGERKVCGLAARRYGTGWLIQGSLLLRPMPAVFRAVMPSDVSEAFAARAISLEEAAGTSMSEADVAARIIHAWTQLCHETEDSRVEVGGLVHAV